MHFRINSRILSIPPFISTSWKNIVSIHLENEGGQPLLIINLTNGSRIQLPPLDPPIMGVIFTAHADSLESDLPSLSNHLPSTPQNPPANEPLMTFDLSPIKIGMAGLENLGSALQHSPEQSESPNLPQEILEKITSISKAMGIEDPNLLPRAEPHCNCVHCQIARAINGEREENGERENPESAEALEEETISDEDLKFRLWDIAQKNEKLYSVTNPLDEKECYGVFLGNPVGCTCGTKNCEHIRAVLNS
jgi:hypothetical protein